MEICHNDEGGNMTQLHSCHTVCDDTQNLNDTESEFFSNNNFFSTVVYPILYLIPDFVDTIHIISDRNYM